MIQPTLSTLFAFSFVEAPNSSIDFTGNFAPLTASGNTYHTHNDFILLNLPICVPLMSRHCAIDSVPLPLARGPRPTGERSSHFLPLDLSHLFRRQINFL